MKNYLKLLGLPTIVAAAAFSTTAHALTIAQVGGHDTFLASTDLGNSGDAAELSWVQSIVGSDVELEFRDDAGTTNWVLADDAGDVAASGDALLDDYYYDLGAAGQEADYFLVKIGTGGTDLVDTHLFQNVGDMQYAVIDFTDAGIDFSVRNISIGRLSHTTGFDGDSTTVPEPSSLALLGLGLVGIGLSRRKLASRK